MVRVRSLRRSDKYLLADLNDALRPRPRRHLAGVAWRWRYEVASLMWTALAVAGLARLLGTAHTVIGVAALPAAVALLPAARRRVVAQAWWFITPHRLRTGFAEARVQSRQGRLPFVLRTTREPFGERALVWCPAGTSAADIRCAREILRAACWAADVRVRRDDRHAHLVAVDVIRRSPIRAVRADGADGADGGRLLTRLDAWRDIG